MDTNHPDNCSCGAPGCPSDHLSADPLHGYSADEIIVGPGGQTLAQTHRTYQPDTREAAVERCFLADGAGEVVGCAGSTEARS